MLKFTKIAFFLICSFSAFALFAQDEEEVGDTDPDNLVPNGSFEKIGEGLRRAGQFDLVEDWSNASEVIGDVFASTTRSQYVAVPKNLYGDQTPAEGDNYAGMVTYSSRSKIMRNYLGVELKQKLKKDNLYCIKFKISLAERARYASNNIGVVMSKSKISEKTTTSISRNDAITINSNDVVKERNGWWEYCKRYAANGTEQYLTLGNFSSDGSTTNELMELPSEFTEKGFENIAYYYVDQVEVRRIETNGNCDCADTKIPDAELIYSSTVQISDDMTAAEKFEAIDAYFYQGRNDLVSAAQRSVDRMVELMKADNKTKILLTGHSDAQEAEKAKSDAKLAKLDVERAENVKKYLISQGIDEGRISVKGVGNSQPASKMSTPISLARNRRVGATLQ